MICFVKDADNFGGNVSDQLATSSEDVAAFNVVAELGCPEELEANVDKAADQAALIFASTKGLSIATASDDKESCTVLASSSGDAANIAKAPKVSDADSSLITRAGILRCCKKAARSFSTEAMADIEVTQQDP